MNMDSSTKNAIKICIDTLSQNWSWIVSKPSAKQLLSLEIVTQCCSNVCLINTRLNWVKPYLPCLQLLGKLYADCSEKYQHSMQKGYVHCEINENPCAFVKQFFEWVLSLHEILKQWKESSYTDFERLHDYKRHHDEITKFAESFRASNCVLSKVEANEKQRAYLLEFQELNNALLVYVGETSEELTWYVIFMLK